MSRIGRIVLSVSALLFLVLAPTLGRPLDPSVEAKWKEITLRTQNQINAEKPPGGVPAGAILYKGSPMKKVKEK